MNANEVIDAEVIAELAEAGIKAFEVIYTNELDCGSFISDTLRVDSSTNRLRSAS